MTWEPSPELFHQNGDVLELEEEEECGILMMRCTGRGRQEHPTVHEMRERVPSQAKAEQHHESGARKKVGMGRSQVLRERCLDDSANRGGRGRAFHSIGSSSVTSESRSLHSSSAAAAKSIQSLPQFMDVSTASVEGYQPTSVSASDHGGARKKTSGRGRAKPSKPSNRPTNKPSSLKKPIAYPYQPQAKIPLPGSEDEDAAEASKRGLAKAHSWLTSGGQTIEYISKREKDLLMQQPSHASGYINTGKVDYDLVIEAGGIFTRNPTTQHNSSSSTDPFSLPSNSTKPSSLDVAYGDSSYTNSLCASSLGTDVRRKAQTAQTLSPRSSPPDDYDLDNLESNSAAHSLDVSPDEREDDEDEQLRDLTDKHFQLAIQESLRYQEMEKKRQQEGLDKEGATAYPPKSDEILPADLEYSSLEGATASVKSSEMLSRDVDLKKHYIDGAEMNPAPMQSTTLTDDLDLFIDLGVEELLEESMHVPIPDQFQDADPDLSASNVLGSNTIKRNSYPKDSCKDDSEDERLRPTVTSSKDTSAASSLYHSEEEEDEETAQDTPTKATKPTYVVIRNVTPSKQSRELIRDIVQSFGAIRDYEEQVVDSGKVEVRICMDRLSEAEHLINCVDGSDSLIEDSVLEVTRWDPDTMEDIPKH